MAGVADVTSYTVTVIAPSSPQYDWSNMIDIERPKDFDEEAYLRENPDAAQYVRSYPETNGWEHFASFGYLNQNRRGVPPRFFDYVRRYREAIEATIRPVAPVHLRKRVSVHENLQIFEGVGRMLAANVFGQLMRVGPYGDDFRILDFGVGCGRVIRPLHELCLDTHLTDSKLHWFGSDIDAEAIAWCSSALESIGTFVVNSHMPPLPFDDQYFDFVYSISIFTHLPESCARAKKLAGFGLERVVFGAGIPELHQRIPDNVFQLPGLAGPPRDRGGTSLKAPRIDPAASGQGGSTSLAIP